jgi:hypothetical protein
VVGDAEEEPILDRAVISGTSRIRDPGEEIYVTIS